jgi:hypothetical protein
MKFFYGFEFEFLYNDKDSVLINELEDLLKLKVRPSGLEYPEIKPTRFEYKLKTDVSGGPKMRELITGVLTKEEGANVLIKMLNWITENAKLNEKCSLHINISCDDNRFRFLNETIFRARLNEERIFELFPERNNNAYCRSVKKFYAKDFSIVSEITKSFLPIFLFPNSKYCGVNFKKREQGYLEFRYIGGAKYSKKITEIIECCEIFENTMQSVIEKDLMQKDMTKILEILKENSKLTDAYTDYTKFENLDIQLSVDLRTHDTLLKSFYPTIRDRIFSLLSGLHKTNEKQLIINYDSDFSRLQLNNFEGSLESIYDIELINSTIAQSDIYNCDIYNSQIDSSIINVCNIYSGSKILNSKCENSYLSNEAKIEKTFFGGVAGILNGRTTDSIVYNCRVGELADIDEKTIKFKTTDIKSGYLVIGDQVIIKTKRY